jgi:hypothetical protein
MQNTKPSIFTKKVNNKYKVIPLNITNNTLGLTRHFPAATKEWFNSVYAFNSNSIKNLTISDKNLAKLIKSYFNLYLSRSILKSKGIATRFRRLAVNKIFISRAELKHTSSKVIITLYVYNEERRILMRKIKRIEAILFSSMAMPQNKSTGNKNLLSIQEKLNFIKNHENNVSFLDWLKGLKSHLVEQIKIENTKNLKDKLSLLDNIIVSCENDPVSFKLYENMYKDFYYKTQLEKEINTIAYYKLLLDLNKSKFENKFLSKLKPLISKLYNKEVEFNIINLKTLYLNSDIFTEAISLKLKNRDNKLLRVLRSALSLVKLPKVNRIKEQYNKINIKELWVNKVNNLNLINSNKDLNSLLLELFDNSSIGVNAIQNKEENNTSQSLISFILNSLNHKNMAGVRLEAKGRLTRRFTASRSVFKIKWKGSLKNIDSSYRGLSSVMLRGHVKSNVQYSVVNSKTRNGAFGLKGWISSK